MTDTVDPPVPPHDRRSRQFSELLRHNHRQRGTTDPRVLDAIEMITDLTRLEARLVQDFEKHVQRPLGLTWAGFRIMNSLWVFGGLPQQEITRLSGTSRASVSSALTTLENRGLVVRRRVDGDRRQLLVELTPEGVDTLHRAIEGQTKRERAWTGALRDDQLSELVHLLRTLVNQETPPAE